MDALRFDDLLAASPGNRLRVYERRPSRADAPGVDVAGLRAEVDRFATLLQESGARRGDRLALWLPNGLPWIVSFLACSRLGIGVVALNTRFRSHDLAAVLRQAGCAWLVYRPGYRGIDFRDILAGVPSDALRTLKARFAVGEPGGLPTGHPLPASTHPTTDRDWHAAVHACGPANDTATGERDEAVIFTTSGTTAAPKLVVHDADGLIAHGRSIAAALGIGPDSVVLLSAPLCGTFGLSSALPALVTGAGLVLDAGLHPADLARAIDHHRVTHTFCNNELLERILDESDRDGADLSSLRFAGFASFAPSVEGLLARGDARGIRMAGLYGSSELQALAATQPPDAPPDIRGLPGGRLVAPDARVRARDPDSGALLPPGQSGAIEILAPSRMRGYAGAADATAAVTTDDGWFRTGDLGRLIDERHFIFEARAGDALRLGGFLVSPKEIEDRIAARPDITACQVVGVVDHGTPVAVAFVIGTPSGPRPDADALRAYCADSLARYKIPRAFIPVDAFPTVQGANGDKIQRSALQDAARAWLAGAERS